MTQTDKFSFFRSYYEAVMQLPSEGERYEFLTGILMYVFDGVIPDFDEFALKLAFTVLRPNLDTSIKRSAAGRKGAEKTNETASRTAMPKRQNLRPVDNSEVLPNRHAETVCLPKDMDRDMDKEGTGLNPYPYPPAIDEGGDAVVENDGQRTSGQQGRSWFQTIREKGGRNA